MEKLCYMKNIQFITLKKTLNIVEFFINEHKVFPKTESLLGGARQSSMNPS
jgi:hypothetical protein